MPLDIVRAEIARFLADSTPDILCLRGNWGVGKTFAWNHYLRDAVAKKQIGFKNYAYVSLFGLNSLEELKYSLFESTRPASTLIGNVSDEPVERGIARLREHSHQVWASIARVPGLRNWTGSSERMLYFLVRKQLVCLDDLERAGSGLSMRDILGLALNLKEQRGCKVALLLNAEELAEDGRKEYEKQLEKVVDTRLQFEPTSIEAAEIALPAVDEPSRLLHDDCVKLGITNIRVIKRIERLARRVYGLVQPQYPRLAASAIHSTVLLAWAVYQPHIAPEVSFLRDFSRIHGLFAKEKTASEEEQQWQELVQAYGWSDFDSLDAAILDAAQAGFVDEERLLREAAALNERTEAAGRQEALDAAWDVYRDSFEDNEDAVLSTIIQKTNENIDGVSPANLNATVRFLKEFDRAAAAFELVSLYVKARAGQPEAFQGENITSFGDAIDPDVSAAFIRQTQSSRSTRSASDVLSDFGTRGGWSPDELTQLAELKADDLYELFKSARGADLHRLLKGALYFRRVTNRSPEMEQVTTNALEALRRIGQESRLNAKRVAMFGIRVEPTKES
jgi:hypothetical protein